MRRRSLTGPLLLLVIGGLFLWRNLHPETPVFELVAQYWPFLLIAWGLLRLIEVLFSRGEGWRSTFTGGEIVLIVLICVAGSGLWAAHTHGARFVVGGLDWFGEQYDYPVSAQAAAANMKRIVFEDTRGNIKVTGVDGQDVTINGHKMIRAYDRNAADRSNEHTPVEIVPQGDRLLIRTNQDRVPDNERISDDLEVTVPRTMAVEARVRSGDYEISDVGGDVELGADRGDVRLSRIGGNARLEVGHSDLIRAQNVTGKIDITGRGSDIELQDISGQVVINGSYSGTLSFKNLAMPLQFEGASRNTELNVQAVPGEIRMDLGEFTAENLTGPIRLVTGSRDVTVTNFTKSIEVQTQRGDITLHPAVPMPAIDAQSDAGRIDVVMPPKATFQLEATAERGEAEDDFGPPIERQMQGRSATLKGKVGDGPMVRLVARHGSVAVRKEGNPPSDDAKSSKSLKDTEIKM